jgi:hypothetical protein
MLEQWAPEQPTSDGMRQYLDDIHLIVYGLQWDVIADAAVFLYLRKTDLSPDAYCR